MKQLVTQEEWADYFRGRIHRLREQRGKLAAEIKALAERVIVETAGKGSLVSVPATTIEDSATLAGKVSNLWQIDVDLATSLSDAETVTSELRRKA